MSLRTQIEAVFGSIGADIKSVATALSTKADLVSGKVPNAQLPVPIVFLTQAAYDALGTKDSSTLYVISG